MKRVGRPRLSGGILWLAIVVVVPLACGGIDSDEIQCEDAIGRLEDCCPSFEPRRFNCENTDGCNPHTPDLNQTASACIRKKSCEDLVAKGTCDAFARIGNEPYPNNTDPAIAQEACK